MGGIVRASIKAIIVLALLAAAPMGARAQAPSSQTLIERPVWARTPSAEMFDIYYPPAAAQADMPGRVTMDCEIGERRRLRRCAVIAETPAGWGFGKAARRLSYQFVISTKTPGGATEGVRVRLPLTFRTADGPPAPATAGAVNLRCLATSSGGVTGCAVVSETPVSAGYDMPALRQAAELRLNPPRPAGSVVEIPVTFDGPPPPPPPAAKPPKRTRMEKLKLLGFLLLVGFGGAVLVVGAVFLQLWLEPRMETWEDAWLRQHGRRHPFDRRPQ